MNARVSYQPSSADARLHRRPIISRQSTAWRQRVRTRASAEHRHAHVHSAAKSKHSAKAPPSKLETSASSSSKLGTCAAATAASIPQTEVDATSDDIATDSVNNIVPAGGLLRGFSKHRALVLDSAYRPINTVNWFKAVCMDVAEKVDVIRYYDAYEPSAYRLHQLPAVMVVRHFVDINEIAAKVALTRRNIMLRDRFCCQYCGSNRNLTLDHVHPQSKGGRNTWDNLVTACMVCNQKKGNRTLQQLGSAMRLRAMPREPKPYEVGALLGVPHNDVENPPPEWADFIAPFRSKIREARKSEAAADWQ